MPNLHTNLTAPPQSATAWTSLPDNLLMQCMDLLPYRVLLKNTDSVFMACNQRLADDLGLPRSHIIGKSDPDFFPPELAQHYRDDDLRVMESNEVLQLEEPYLKGEEVHWLTTTKFPLHNEQGTIIGIGLFFEDITEKKQLHDKIQQEKRLHARQLELALEDALGAISALLEQRDPYTAGHQKHVAMLATAIGCELKLEDQVLRGLYLGAMVHDIGKIQIPADILTKPDRLTAVEFELVKEHPTAGYRVLKDIDFPWPIAKMILQHHEYLDGSGYPQGLKGEQILLEARILTVADIVESMSSDRPYRAALGIQQAREYIVSLRGTQLDEQVVDACLRILDRGDFTPHQLGNG